MVTYRLRPPLPNRWWTLVGDNWAVLDVCHLHIWIKWLVILETKIDGRKKSGSLVNLNECCWYCGESVVPGGRYRRLWLDPGRNGPGWRAWGPDKSTPWRWTCPRPVLWRSARPISTRDRAVLKKTDPERASRNVIHLGSKPDWKELDTSTWDANTCPRNGL